MAVDIYSLLNIDKDLLEDFSLQALDVTDRRLAQTLDRQVQKLADIERSMLTDVRSTATRRSVEEIIEKVRAAIQGTEVTWAAYELRIMSYYIMYFEPDDAQFRYVVKLLGENWRPIFFNGLVFYVLNSWNAIKPQYRSLVCGLVTSQLESYDGNNRKYNLLKSSINLFEESGAARVAALVEQKNIHINDAPTLFGFKSSSITMSYYSDAIVKYYSKRAGELDDAAEVLTAHNNDRTNKLLIAELVSQAESSGDMFFQSRVSKLGNKLLKDISQPTNWAPFPGATDEQIAMLRRARELVNQWYVRKVIEVFFEVCVQDKERQRFWLKYCKMVSKFFIAGSSLVWRRIAGDNRIGAIVNSHFIDTNSRVTQTAALIMYIKDKVFVEFSDCGALYVYNNDDYNIRFIQRGIRYITKIDELKSPYASSLVYDSKYYRYFRETGKVIHLGNWMNRLSDWIDNKVVPTNYENREDVSVFQQVDYLDQSSELDFREETGLKF